MRRRRSSAVNVNLSRTTPGDRRSTIVSLNCV